MLDLAATNKISLRAQTKTHKTIEGGVVQVSSVSHPNNLRRLVAREGRSSPRPWWSARCTRTQGSRTSSMDFPISLRIRNAPGSSERGWRSSISWYDGWGGLYNVAFTEMLIWKTRLQVANLETAKDLASCSPPEGKTWSLFLKVIEKQTIKEKQTIENKQASKQTNTQTNKQPN